jgi:hypothetical protein
VHSKLLPLPFYSVQPKLSALPLGVCSKGG